MATNSATGVRSANQSDSRSRQSLSQRRPQARVAIVGTCIFLAAITWIVFGQTLGHDFINYDDDAYVYKNPVVSGGLSLHGIRWAFTHSHADNWHPLTSISHMLDCQLYGLKAGGHHFTNVFLHTLAIVLLFLVFREMTGALWRSAFVAALFAIHPLRVESVAWVAERKDVLSGVFFMLTLGAYLRYVRKPSLARYATMSILFACGLMSKPTLVPVPFVLLLLDYWPLKRESKIGKLIIEKIPLLVLSAGSCIATVLAQTRVISSIGDLPLPLRINNAAVSCVTYIGQMFWPVKLAVFYPYLYQRPAWMIALSISLLVGITVAAVMLRRKRGYLFVGWFWYLGMLVPVAGIVQVGLQGHADRYTYLPHIGLSLLVTWGIADLAADWRYRREILSVGAAAVIGALAWRARIQTAFWRDGEILFRRALAVTTYNDVAHTSLGELLLTRDRVDEAIAHLQEAVAIRPELEDEPKAHNILGIAFFRVRDTSKGIAHWKRALEIEPHNPTAQSNLAWVFATSPEVSVRDGVRAVEMIQDVLQRSGTRTAILLHTLAAAYAECGRFSEAIDTAQDALDLAVVEGNSALAADLQRNIDNYKMNTPLRDPSLANPHP